MGRLVFVAPHYDDVALSCGGSVAVMARSSSPLIVTVFGGKPTGADSEFVRFQHERWGLNALDAVDARRQEDACAAQSLGASVSTRWLDFLDAIYRNPAYDSDDALFGAVHPDDELLPSSIAAALMRLEADEFYVPLALGKHVDHQLVRIAGLRIAQTGTPVWAYPDVPYVLTADPSELEVATRGLQLQRIDLDEEALARRHAAVACYVTQLPVLFRDIGDPSQTLGEYLTRLGAGRPAEVVYRVTG